ncbi:PASTA domain-containing protein [Oscillospiraceae bacterium PP1C4]
MAVNEVRLCMGCMSPLFEDGRCSVCGYDEHLPADLNFLPPHSRLTDRYIVGRLANSDPEGAWYVGYDSENETRVWIREYVPSNITRRDHQDFSVCPLASSEAQYKALMADFEDLCRSIRQLSPSEKVIPITDMVRANNTMYAIYRYIKTITLEAFLDRSGGKLTWRHTKKLLMPLYHTVANIHKAGLIHRGLSPQTIHLDQSGALWLSSFTVAAARTNKSELSAQLFNGYAAPEQYSLNSWQGTWTDVYALGAITYRAVTGELPPAALDRVYGDDLLDSKIANAEMNECTVNAINKALAFEVEDRTQTAESLIAELLATEGSNTAVYTAPAGRKFSGNTDGGYQEELRQPVAVYAGQSGQQPRSGSRYDDYDGGIELVAIPDMKKPETVSSRSSRRPSSARKSARRSRKGKKSHPVLLLVLSALVATSLLGFAMYWITTNFLADLVSPSSSQSSSQANAAGVNFEEDQISNDDQVPKFVGTTAESIKNNAKLNERFKLVYQEAFNDDYEAGVVFEQQPVEGTKMPNAGQVTLFVSKGAEKVEMPNIVELSLEEATAKLGELQIKYDIIPVYNDTYEPGVVVRTDKEAGTMLDKNHDTVIIYIKKESDAPDYSKEDAGDKKSSSSKKSSSKASSKKGETVFYDENGNKVIIFEKDNE